MCCRALIVDFNFILDEKKRLKFNGILLYICKIKIMIIGPRQANLVLITYASSEGSGEPAHPRSLARTSAARSYKQ